MKRRPGLDPKEDQLQMLVFDMIRLFGHPDLIAYHAFNEGHRAARSREFYARLGMYAGLADVCLVLPDLRPAYLELKTVAGRLSADQRAFRDRCERRGIPHAVACTAEQAAEILHGWGALVANPLNARRAA